MYTEQKQNLNNVSPRVLDDVIETIAALTILISRLITRFVRSEAMLPILIFYECAMLLFCLIQKLKRLNNE